MAGFVEVLTVEHDMTLFPHNYLFHSDLCSRHASDHSVRVSEVNQTPPKTSMTIDKDDAGSLVLSVSAFLEGKER